AIGRRRHARAVRRGRRVRAPQGSLDVVACPRRGRRRRGWLDRPRTLGVGYVNIEQTLSGAIVGKALVVLVIFKFISWVIALASGTSGGTLAPLFTIGGGFGV